MDINELLEKLRAADCALETWKAENGLSDADGVWSGVGIALDAVEKWARNRATDGAAGR